MVDPRYTFEFTTAGVTLTEHVFGVVVGAEAEPILSREHVEYRWAELSDAVRLLRYASNKASVRHVHDLVAAGGRSRRTSGQTMRASGANLAPRGAFCRSSGAD